MLSIPELIVTLILSYIYHIFPSAPDKNSVNINKELFSLFLAYFLKAGSRSDPNNTIF